MISVADRQNQSGSIVAAHVQPGRESATRREPPIGGHSSAKAWRRTIWTLLTLAGGPVHREGLLARVAARGEEFGEDAYNDPSAAPHALRHDLGRLRATGIVVTYRRTDATYTLEPPPLTLRLTEAELVAAALLRDSFAGSPHGPAVQALLGQLQRLLPAEQRAALAAMRPPVRAELVDHAQDFAAHGPVVATLQRALRWHQQVEFTYQSPSAGEAKWHRVEPTELVYEDRHLYLHVWDHHFHSAGRYRIERIVPESLTVLPGVLPVTERHVRRRELRFRLTPERARYGVTERFPEQRVEPQEDGSIIVTAQMPDQFTALQTLLRYGDGVECLAPEEVRAELSRIGAALVQQYEQGPGMAAFPSTRLGRLHTAPSTSS